MPFRSSEVQCRAMGSGSPPVSPSHFLYPSAFRLSCLLARVFVPRPTYRQVRHDVVLQSSSSMLEVTDGSEPIFVPEQEAADKAN